MEPDRNLMTADALAALTAEIEQLETVDRQEIAKRIKTAREWGDLKENAEYHDAKNSQAHLETKIKRLRHQLKHAEVVEVAGGDEVSFGSTVEVEDEGSGKRNTYTLVALREAAPAEGKVAYDSPIGVALQGKATGDVASFQTPRGERRLKILSVS